MKKVIALATALICMAVVFVSCAKESTFQPTEVENVSMSISDISPTGATVIIKDLNVKPYIYGEWYTIEKGKNGGWYEVDTIIDNYGFNDLGYIPDNNGEIKFTVDWEWLYGELPSGNYRLLKQVNLQYITAQFSVE